MSSFWEKLHISKWNECSVEERLQALQELENHEAKLQGRAPCPVELTESPDVYGLFEPNTGTIQINIDLLQEDQCYEAVDTILHEGRHAYQYHVLKEKQPIELVNQWSENMRAYFLENPDYMLQPIEWDTHHYALKKTKEIYQELEEKYGKNSGFKEYEEVNIKNINDQKIEAQIRYQEDYMQTIQSKVKKYYDLIRDVYGKHGKHVNSLYEEMERFIHEKYDDDTSLSRFETYLEEKYLKGLSLDDYIKHKQQSGQLDSRRFLTGVEIEELIKLTHARKEIPQQEAGHVNPSKVITITRTYQRNKRH